MSKMYPTVQEWAKGRQLSEEVRHLKRLKITVDRFSRSGVPHEFQMPCHNFVYYVEKWLEESGEK